MSRTRHVGQPEALALYGNRGYRSIPSYGDHEVALAFEWTVAAAP